MVNNSENFTFIEICPVSDLPPGERMFLDLAGEPIVVFNIAGNIYAIGDVCTHDGGPLGDGDLDDHQVICPRHGARFDVRDGRALRMPAVVSAPSFPVQIEAGVIFLGVLK